MRINRKPILDLSHAFHPLLDFSPSHVVSKSDVSFLDRLPHCVLGLNFFLLDDFAFSHVALKTIVLLLDRLKSYTFWLYFFLIERKLGLDLRRLIGRVLPREHAIRLYYITPSLQNKAFDILYLLEVFVMNTGLFLIFVIVSQIRDSPVILHIHAFNFLQIVKIVPGFFLFFFGLFVS